MMSNTATFNRNPSGPVISPNSTVIGEEKRRKVTVSNLIETPAPTSTPDNSTTITKEKPRTGWYWRHMPDEDANMRYLNSRGLVEWRCKYCIHGRYQISGGSRSIIHHLKQSHNINEASPREEKTKSQQISIEQATKHAAENPHKRRHLAEESGSLDAGTLEVLYTKFIAVCNLPLRLVECEEFQAFLAYLNRDVNAWLPKSHHTIREWVMRQRDSVKAQIKSRLHSSRTLIHISCDIWTSPNSLAILGVIAHYIADDGKLERSLLAMKNIVASHEGTNLAQYIIAVIQDWELASKLGYFQMDNAANNDTMLKEASFCKVCSLLLGFSDTLQ
jgi:hypothetical protein